MKLFNLASCATDEELKGKVLRLARLREKCIEKGNLEFFLIFDVKPTFLGGPTTGSWVSPSSTAGVYAECGMRILGMRKLTVANITQLTAGEEPILRVAAKIAEVRTVYVEKVFEILGQKTNMDGLEDLVEVLPNVVI